MESAGRSPSSGSAPLAVDPVKTHWKQLRDQASAGSEPAANVPALATPTLAAGARRSTLGVMTHRGVSPGSIAHAQVAPVSVQDDFVLFGFVALDLRDQKLDPGVQFVDLVGLGAVLQATGAVAG